MIIDTLKNAGRYKDLHPRFARAFAYIRSLDLTASPTGEFSVDGSDLRAIFSYKMGMTAAESVAEFECHNQHIDIQICIHGKEMFGWKPRNNCTQPKGDYDPEKDFQLYNDSPDMFFQLTDGQFVILFPEDVHAPLISDQMIRKVVLKVKI